MVGIARDCEGRGKRERVVAAVTLHSTQADQVTLCIAYSY